MDNPEKLLQYQHRVHKITKNKAGITTQYVFDTTIPKQAQNKT